MIRRPIPTGSKTTPVTTNGHARRRLASWIDSFVEYTANLEVPEIFRRWTAITTIGAVLEQKVWVDSASTFYPNFYTVLVGHPGVGKTRTVRISREFVAEIPEFLMAPTSVTTASLVDAMVRSKRTIVRLPEDPLEYNTMLLAADELGAFMSQYDKDIIAVLSSFYNADPYAQERRGNDLRIKLKKPLLSLLCGSTPSNLIEFIPENAWTQGFTSRLMLIYSDAAPLIEDIFSIEKEAMPLDMIHDLKHLNTLVGPLLVTNEYRTALANWRRLGQQPVPTHPRLTHYCTRRLEHMIKLSMVASIDRADDLRLEVKDFNRAMGWLLDAESYMPEIFHAGTPGADAMAMDELFHFIQTTDIKKIGISEHKLVKFVADRVPAHSVLRVLELMERSGKIEMVRKDEKTGLRWYRACWD